MTRSLAYFACVFGAGFLLGPVRVLWLAPRVGERAAELLEAPVMLAVIVLSARWVVRRFPASSGAAQLGSGGIALLLVLVAEGFAVTRVRGLSLAEYVSGRDPVAGVVYLGLLLAFAGMPWAVARLGGLRGGSGGPAR